MNSRLLIEPVHLVRTRVFEMDWGTWEKESSGLIMNSARKKMQVVIETDAVINK